MVHNCHIPPAKAQKNVPEVEQLSTHQKTPDVPLQPLLKAARQSFLFTCFHSADLFTCSPEMVKYL